MENSIDSTNEIKHGRPTLLSVTCVLTWACCALLLISSLSGLITQSPEKQLEQIEQLRKISPEAADKMEAALADEGGAKKILTTLLNILAIALCAFGAVQMWNLKQTGFYFYLIGEVVPYIGLIFGGTDALAAASAMAGSMGSAVIGIVITLLIVFDAVFIVLYAVNLKYMVPPSQFD
ncbi:MAG: hypothetical protein JNJ41_14355 [Bacteroidia bacterium]|nr:hypothetical protein [Bacteroidia bacterium]